MEKRETFAQALCDILVKNKVVKPEEARAMQRAFKNSSKESFDDFLLEEGLVEEAPLLKALSDLYEVPAIDVVGYFFETFLLHKFPKDFLLRKRIIPLQVDENILIMVASNPNDSELLPEIGEYVSYDIQFYVGLGRDIEDAVKEYYEDSLTQGYDYDKVMNENEIELELHNELLLEEDESPKIHDPSANEDEDLGE
ncbi:MAG: hypothetical protein ACOYT8_00410 [Candidatus Dependentiae bacterium]